jgi:hypothetical protein
MFGKEKCRILKEIRQKIADENKIPFVTQECRHQGNCSGTCPRCESELRYLEQQLERRAALGKRISVAALCAGMAFSGAACGLSIATPPAELGGTPVPTVTVSPTEEPEPIIEMGEVAVPFDDETSETALPSENTPVPSETDSPTESTPVPSETGLPPENTPFPVDDFELSGMISYDG